MTILYVFISNLHGCHKQCNLLHNQMSSWAALRNILMDSFKLLLFNSYILVQNRNMHFDAKIIDITICGCITRLCHYLAS